jgi:hypothetical protein
MLARPYAATPTDTILHLIRETLIKHQTGAAQSTGDDFDHLVALADLTEELDQRLTTGGALPTQWRHHR